VHIPPPDILIGSAKRKKMYPIIVLDRPLGLQEVEASRISRISSSEGGKVVGLNTSHLYPQGNTHGTHFC
jgi:hypothetical protein